MKLPHRNAQLKRGARIDIVYQDSTQFGSVVGNRIERTIRALAAEIRDHRASHGMAETVLESRALLDRLFAGPLEPLFESSRSSPSSHRLDESCLYPDASSVRATAIVVSIDQNEAATIPLGSDAKDLASWIGELHRGTERPEAPFGRALFDALQECGALATDPDELSAPPSSDAVFIGHASAAIGGSSRTLVDPYFLPVSSQDHETYHPLAPADLDPIERVLITHSHPDHFDLGSLLLFGADIPIVVPHVDRESLQAIDMGARLSELGFRNVSRVKPGDTIATREGAIHVLPFFGEQPTTGDVLHPEVRNVGCSYLIESARKRSWLVADAGRDREGDVRDLAGDVARRFGRVDLLFGGYRGFAIYPLHYLFSSVARYLLFVPRDQWGARQACMNDAGALIDTGERCDARAILPYADGGAPWYWRRGLGPVLDGSATRVHRAVDPPPEDVSDEADTRSTSLEGAIASPVSIVIARPGEALSISDRAVLRSHGARQKWPFSSKKWLQFNAALVRHEGNAIPSARAVLHAFEAATERWRKEETLASFHFMRKPPDVRLRFLADETLAQSIESLFEGLVRDGAVEKYFKSAYEPETARFGGARAMAAIHDWFDRDTRAWLSFDTMRASNETKLEPEILCAAVAHHLVTIATDGGSEAWDVWRSFAEPYQDQDQGSNASILETLPDLQEMLAHANTAENKLLHACLEASTALAETLRRLWSEGALTAGMRSVLGTVALFHFHRYGLSARAHAGISLGLVKLLAPAPR